VNIGEICTRSVVFCTPGTTIVDAAHLMREHHVGDLVVVEERNGKRYPVGVATDRDITVEIVALNVPLDRLSIGDIMTRKLISVTESEDAFNALELMRRKGVRRLPVVDRQGALAGVVALDDLLEVLAEELSLMVKLISRQSSQEVRSRPALASEGVGATQ
jgi:CBS domain-containing protein